MKNSDETIFNGLTFDDVLLIPQYSEIVPAGIITEVKFARDLVLQMPIISAAMDTVTESKVAQVMAQHGGIGVIHKNMSIQSQSFQVDKVKKYESGMITDPITLSPEHMLWEALQLMKKYSISGLPITQDEKLVGILTNRDLRFERNLEQKVSEVMTKENLVTTTVGTTLEEAKGILHENRIEKLPVIGSHGELKGLITIKDIEKSRAFPQATKDGRGRLVVGAAVGVDATTRDRVENLVASGVDMIVVDTAHGHSKNVIETLKHVHEVAPDVILVGGNVVTEEGAAALFDAGADVVKVGVGPGSICTTRIVAGVGMPQMTAVLNCSKAAKSRGKTIISDGGIKYSGDITKALAVGANAVMIGSLLAGSEESPGETILYQGRSYKSYRGMGSLGAMARGSKDRYGQANVADEKLVPEGIEGKVPYKGSVSAILHQLMGGVRSGMGYLGASSVEDLQQRAQFVKISPQGLRESHVHDVSITKEAPNYRVE